MYENLHCRLKIHSKHKTECILWHDIALALRLILLMILLLLKRQGPGYTDMFHILLDMVLGNGFGIGRRETATERPEPKIAACEL